jgi:hypothetical protein
MKFKAEVCLLSLALLLFAASAFFYSYQTVGSNLTLNLASYPYQGYSIMMVAFGSVLTVAAFVSYSRRGKSIYGEGFEPLGEDKSN